MKVTMLQPPDLKVAGHKQQSVAQSLLAGLTPHNAIYDSADSICSEAAFISATAAWCLVKLAARTEIGVGGGGDGTGDGKWWKRIASGTGKRGRRK